jgi:hypothetical protein
MEAKMPATELLYAPFHCARLNRKVILTSIQFFPESDGSAVLGQNQEVVFDCAEKKTCGVCSEWGRTRSYDWGKCSHPNLKKTVSE